MSAYLAIVQSQVKKVLQYRAAALSGMITQLFFGFVRIEAMLAFYAQTGTKPPIALDATITYIWLTQMLLGFIAYRPNPEVVQMIKTGSLAYEMVRPLRLSLAWFNISLANRVISAGMRFLPFLPIVLLLPEPYKLSLTPSVFISIVFIVDLILAGIVSAAFNNLFNVMAVYLMSDDGIVRMLPILSFFFTGLILPLPLLPNWLQPFAYALPFAGFMDFPARILTGDITGWGIAFAMLHQISWSLALIALADFLMERRLRNVVIHGG